MEFLKRLRGPLLTIIAVVLGFLALRAGPSMLWPERGKSLVRDEGFQAGHQTIGINERALQKDSNTILFSQLKKWRFEKDRPTPAPKNVMEYNNQLIRIAGFMYPLESGTQISTFCLLRSTQTCCYGPRPQYNQYILVEMDHPVAFERFRPVEVKGTFYVEPRPEDGYIYRMEGKSAKVLTG